MMNFEKARLEPLETANRPEKPFQHERSERIAESFRDAVDGSLVTLVESFRDADDQHVRNEKFLPDGLSDYERTIWQRAVAERKEPALRFLVDIDGVLIDTDEKIMNFLREIMRGNAEGASRIAKEKMQVRELRTLLRCRDAASETPDGKRISIITDRFSAGAVCFPCFNRSESKVFEKHGIPVHTMVLKPISAGRNIHPDRVDVRDDLIYYFGSSGSDQALARRIRERINADGENPEKLVYVEIRPHGKRSVL